MRFPVPLVPATLICRYKRFLADIRLAHGTQVTAHCPNPGAMLGLADPGLRIWVEPNDSPKKKLKYAWRLVEFSDHRMVGIDTAVPNRVVGDALRARQVPDLAAYPTVRAEVAYGARSRVDFLLCGAGLADLYLEVKNVHLRRTDDWAEFPDSVTARGTRHLQELSNMVAQGYRAVMLYLVQRTDCTRLAIAADIDPDYARAFGSAVRAGVEMVCYDTAITPEGVTLRRQLPIALDGWRCG